MRLIFRTLFEEEFHLNGFSAAATVGQVKLALQPVLTAEPARQRVIFRTRELQDASSLASCGVEDGAVMHVVLRASYDDADSFSAKATEWTPAPDDRPHRPHVTWLPFVALRVPRGLTR